MRLERLGGWMSIGWRDTSLRVSRWVGIGREREGEKKDVEGMEWN